MIACARPMFGGNANPLSGDRHVDERGLTQCKHLVDAGRFTFATPCRVTARRLSVRGRRCERTGQRPPIREMRPFPTVGRNATIDFLARDASAAAARDAPTLTAATKSRRSAISKRMLFLGEERAAISPAGPPVCFWSRRHVVRRSACTRSRVPCPALLQHNSPHF